MDSYVVRIYRRDLKEPRRMAGVVEQAGMEGQIVFHDLEELSVILSKRGSNHKGHKTIINRGKKRDGFK